MCKAMEEVRAEAYQEGYREAYQEGWQEATEMCVRNLMVNLHLTAEQAMDLLQLPQEERAALLQIL